MKLLRTAASLPLFRITSGRCEFFRPRHNPSPNLSTLTSPGPSVFAALPRLLVQVAVQREVAGIGEGHVETSPRNPA